MLVKNPGRSGGRYSSPGWRGRSLTKPNGAARRRSGGTLIRSPGREQRLGEFVREPRRLGLAFGMPGHRDADRMDRPFQLAERDARRPQPGHPVETSATPSPAATKPSCAIALPPRATRGVKPAARQAATIASE